GLHNQLGSAMMQAGDRGLFTEIRTGRLIPRALEGSDARIFRYRPHPDVSRFQCWGTNSIGELEEQIEELSASTPATAGKWYQLGIVLRSSSELIGDCAFHLLEAEPRLAEFGNARSGLPRSRLRNGSRVRLTGLSLLHSR